MPQNEARDQKIRETVEEILKRKEFQQADDKNPIADMIKQVWESIIEWVQGLFENRHPRREVQFNDLFNQNIQTVLKIVLIVLAAILLFFLIRFILPRIILAGKAKKNKVPKAHDYLENPDLAVEKMKSLMEQGQYTEAMRFLFIAVLLEFHKRKIIHLEKWKTNRVYMREIVLNSPELTIPMRELSTVFNALCYGRRTIDEVCMSTWFNFYMNERGRFEKEDQKGN